MSSPPPATDVRVVLVTAPDAEVAKTLARALVDERLCACVNLVPAITSVYRWEGEVQEDNEALLIIKTTDASVDALRARVEALHPYDVPEVIALDVTAGAEAYLGWVRKEVLGG
jgi:periplasmic divalent cation tolerance protein